MKEILSRILIIISAIIFILAIVFVVAKYEASKLAETWNSGYCECGGHWRYEQAVGHRSNTTYIYKCDECGNRIEISKCYPEVD